MASPFGKRSRPVRPGSPFQQPVSDYTYNLLLFAIREPRDMQVCRSGEILVREVIAGATRTAPKVAPDGSKRADLEDQIRSFQRSAARRSAREPRQPQPAVAQNLALIAELFELNPVERSVFQFLCAAREHPGLDEILDSFSRLNLRAASELIGVATGVRSEHVLKALGKGGRLVRSGLVTVEDSIYDLNQKLVLKDGLLDAVLTPGLDRQGLFERFLPAAPACTLDVVDFAHLEPEVRSLRALLAAALRERRAGINVLLHGPSGTGKTQLASLVARELGMPLYACGQADEDGESDAAGGRLSSLLMGQALASATCRDRSSASARRTF